MVGYDRNVRKCESEHETVKREKPIMRERERVVAVS